MWEYMKLRRALVSNTTAGIKRVLQGNYGFIHDAPVLQYRARKKHCGQIKLIGGFDHGWVLALNSSIKPGSNYDISRSRSRKQRKRQKS